MKMFITPVSIPKPDARISYSDTLFFVGSCFSEYIGNKFKELRFRVCFNPFGTIYNPFSIFKTLERIPDAKDFTANDLRFSDKDELWFSYLHNTLFSHPDSNTCLSKINNSLHLAREALKKAKFIIITPGTSWTYRLNETGEIVANCHKQPASFFKREFLSSEESFELFRKSVELVRAVNPEINFIFTISPIRHWKDGATGNQRSKAALILAVAKLQEWDNKIYYFPSYEIFMDELRDYRFYGPDMLHPSETGQKYIFEKFVETFVDEKDKKLMDSVEKILLSVKHKPFYPNTGSYQKFKEHVISRIHDIIDKNPHIDLDEFLSDL